MASRLTEERHRLKLSQAQLALMTQISKGSQAGYERGARPPDARYLAFAHKAGCDVHYIVTGESAVLSQGSESYWHAHDQILKTIEDWLKEHRLTLEFNKRMELLRLFMSRFERSQDVDLVFVRETLKHVA
jgi:transcriptional regulator with XRE-family HTH domain